MQFELIVFVDLESRIVLQILEGQQSRARKKERGGLECLSRVCQAESEAYLRGTRTS